MAPSAHLEIFKELFEMSKLQAECISDGRIDDAVKILKGREVLITRLKDEGASLDCEDDEARGIIKEITSSDEHMMLVLTERRDSTTERIKKRIEAKKVISAYNETDKTR